MIEACRLLVVRPLIEIRLSLIETDLASD